MYTFYRCRHRHYLLSVVHRLTLHYNNKWTQSNALNARMKCPASAELCLLVLWVTISSNQRQILVTIPSGSGAACQASREQGVQVLQTAYTGERDKQSSRTTVHTSTHNTVSMAQWNSTYTHTPPLLFTTQTDCCLHPPSA